MRASLYSFFILFREVDLENVSLVLGELLKVFVNRLIADDKYLHLPIQMQLSEKRKTFFLIFCSISRIYIKF